VFAVTLYLDTGRTYQYRYLIDGTDWMNDPFADRTAPNPFGEENAVLDLTDTPA
jgi:hypothetical protein